MKDIVEQLFTKAQAHKESYNTFSDRDIRTSFFGTMVNQCATVHINLTINERYIEEGSKACRTLFANDQGRVDNYKHHFTQNCRELIVEAALFQSELVFRTLSANLTGNDIYDGSTLPQLVSRLFVDTENNWQKEESKLVILLSTIRNTIHTGGVYFKKTAGDTKDFKGNNYTFTYGKPPTFSEGITILDLVSEFFDAMKVLFDSPNIASIGPLEHPNYHAIEE
ncbi:hypothetical protein [Spirosoma endbachense]|uniref:Uncharacterized protein n=1 Tax=Spirosoma endbachense TaxID=2666025 RepID=A0A6P1W5V2_9BACT|nr:hypothetical protein [Spirosoma endbachense]QHV99310.1 hypothetical protein GJR95_31760 [Spirosoma endbachense]